MTLYKKVIFKNGTKNDRKILLELSKDDKLSKNVEIVYIYSIKNKTINYPLQDGQILYIGEACREKESTAKRFSQHISTGKNKGADTGTNYALSMYYWNNTEMILDIYIIKENRKQVELKLLQLHLKKYGSLPIAQGSTGTNYTVDTINTIENEEYQNSTTMD